MVLLWNVGVEFFTTFLCWPDNFYQCRHIPSPCSVSFFVYIFCSNYLALSGKFVILLLALGLGFEPQLSHIFFTIISHLLYSIHIILRLLDVIMEAGLNSWPHGLHWPSLLLSYLAYPSGKSFTLLTLHFGWFETQFFHLSITHRYLLFH